MHRSRLAGFIVDCQTTDLDAASQFWQGALGMAQRAKEGARYVILDAASRGLHIEVQRVSHESRVHLDIETDNVEAEVQRLEGLGARRLEKIQTWWVMQAPTGHNFCVVRAKKPLDGEPGTTTWP